jgi:DNA (cytosine-5)-methyltransferase 1
VAKIRVASFFAGAGGLDLGLDSDLFDIVYATDIDRDCCKTLELNRGRAIRIDAEIVHNDIRLISVQSLPEEIDLVVGGPPCQSFSASGRRAGGAAGRLDDRGNLFEKYCEIIDFLKPKAFLFENVRGILATNKGKDWQAIISKFESIGYRLSYRILDAADFGIPQHRERIFLVGRRDGKDFLFPRPAFGPDSPNARKHVSPKTAFDGLVVGNDEAPSLKFEGGKYSHLLPEVPPGQNYLYFTAKRGHPHPIFAYRSRFSDFLYKAHPVDPMKTIIASPGKYTGPLHWENRLFSISEYKAIQGFPQDYRFHGDRASIVRQIGNSVSPRIAEAIGDALAYQVFGAGNSKTYLDNSEILTFDHRKGSKAAKTRKMHEAIDASRMNTFSLSNPNIAFECRIEPSSAPGRQNNMFCRTTGRVHWIELHGGQKEDLSAQITIDFWPHPRKFDGAPGNTLIVKLFGRSEFSPRLIWNAVDEWVRRRSSFHSLFELYGHFTEPYPYFRVSDFDILEADDLLEFTRIVSDQDRCSKYLDKAELVEQFSSLVPGGRFDDLANRLRELRFDVRTRETNIAIPEGKYMMAYPFTLPESKQMNFSIKKPRTDRLAESYVTEKRVKL